MANTTIYKLMIREEWEAAQAIGVYRGSAPDLRDGFIHFSTAAQLRETARKHFSGVADLILLAVDTEELAFARPERLLTREGQSALKWETSRGGDLFPHLYGELSLGAVISVTPLRLGVDGMPVLPQDLAS
jgi:uncharacterized protein (DUF952 family)